MEHELLIPCGNYKSLIQAIKNGCDAVYLGGKKYSARAFCDNFTIEEIEQATKLSHKYGVKLYITANTLIYEREFEEAIDYVRTLYKIGVDAVIMQDIGLITECRKRFPNLIIHSSTQMHNITEENLMYLKKLGVKRAVFARELNIDTINNFKTDIEKEAFIHGALCISYSGQCLFSSCILNRSANRGECAGMCRLPYKFLVNGEEIKTNGEYLLSPKDLSSFDNFKQLMDSNILSFKIEGRLKSPLYTAILTKIYRNLINKHKEGKQLEVANEDIDLLKSVFYREWTGGFLFNSKNIMNYKSCNHIGIKAGKVIDINKKYIRIKLDKELKQKDGIRFHNSNIGINLNFIYDKNGKLINKGKKDDIIQIDNFINLKILDDIYLTNPFVECNDDIDKKIKIKINFVAKCNAPTILNIEDEDGNKVTKYGVKVIEAKGNGTQESDIAKSLLKLGNTIFTSSIENVNLNVDSNIFIKISDINELRRQATDELCCIRENKKVEFFEISDDKDSQNNEDNFEKTKTENNKIIFHALARNKEQIDVLQKMQNKIENKIFDNRKIEIQIYTDDENLVSDNIFYKIPRNEDKLNYDINKKYLTTSYSSMFKYKNNNVDYFLNITNSKSFNEISKYASIVCLSVENTFEDTNNILNKVNDISKAEVFIYGSIELMMTKACIVSNIFGNELCDKSLCNICSNKNKYAIVDRNNETYPVLLRKKEHTSYIMNYKKKNDLKNILKYVKMGVTNFRIDLLYEDNNEIDSLFDNIWRELK